MKTNIGVFFGGRSTEHEISVISASQAMHAIDREKYNVTPIYITKKGVWYTGDALFDVANYRDIDALLKQCEQVYMKPIFGDYNLYKEHKSMFKSDVLTHLDVVIPVLHGSNGERKCSCNGSSSRSSIRNITAALTALAMPVAMATPSIPKPKHNTSTRLRTVLTTPATIRI